MKNRYNILILKALKFFVENPYEEIHLREFSRRLGISVNSAQRFLGLFLKESLIKEERKAHLRYFKANLDSIVFRNIKIGFSLKVLEDSGLVESLREYTSNTIIFGSVAEGLDDYGSDIDLVCISVNSRKTKEIILKAGEKLNKEINCHVFSWSEWKKQAKLNRAFYLDVITKGINLIGDTPIVE